MVVPSVCQTETYIRREIYGNRVANVKLQFLEDKGHIFRICHLDGFCFEVACEEHVDL